MPGYYVINIMQTLSIKNNPRCVQVYGRYSVDNRQAVLVDNELFLLLIKAKSFIGSKKWKIISLIV